MNELYKIFLQRPELTVHKWHSYFPVYEKHFAKFRGKPVRMLEIGVQNGGSARMFREWLGPEAHITGLDIDPKCRNFAIPGAIDIEIGSQSDVAFLQEAVKKHGPWDIILDDGGHTNNQIMVSFETLFPHLNDGGVYLIEDTHANFWGGGFLDRADKKTLVEFVGELFAFLHGWTGKGGTFEHWHVPPPARKERTPAPYETRHINAVHLYDSIIVVDKLRRPEPYCERHDPAKGRETAFHFSLESGFPRDDDAAADKATMPSAEMLAAMRARGALNGQASDDASLHRELARMSAQVTTLQSELEHLRRHGRDKLLVRLRQSGAVRKLRRGLARLSLRS